jgi:ribosomal protein S12 methylthiotransferase accessory factor
MTTWRLRKASNSFDRTVPPSETVKRLMQMREHFGITRVSDLTGLDDLGIPVHVAVRPRSSMSTSVHSGKGLTAEDSLASALAEAIELDCAERFLPADLVRGSFNEVSRRYATFRPRLGIPGRPEIPAEMELNWVWVENLLAAPSAAKGLLPLDLFRQGKADHPPRELMAECSSNGLASGNIREEAICHALDELVERDALHQFLYQAKYLQRDLRGQYGRIKLATLPPQAMSLATRVLDSARTLRLMDLTSDIRIPVVAALVGQSAGFGASLSAERAIVRAITEAVQTSAINIAGAREDLAPGARDPRIHDDWRRNAYRIKQLVEDPYCPERSYEKLPSRSTAFVDEDLHLTLEILQDAGIDQVLVCDIGDESCSNFAVVKIFIPGLEQYRHDAIGPRCLRHAIRA